VLVITRQQNEAIIFELPDGKLAKIIIVRSNSAIRIGIDAPKNVIVLREELYIKNKSQKEKRGNE